MVWLLITIVSFSVCTLWILTNSISNTSRLYSVTLNLHTDETGGRRHCLTQSSGIVVRPLVFSSQKFSSEYGGLLLLSFWNTDIPRKGSYRNEELPKVTQGIRCLWNVVIFLSWALLPKLETTESYKKRFQWDTDDITIHPLLMELLGTKSSSVNRKVPLRIADVLVPLLRERRGTNQKETPL